MSFQTEVCSCSNFPCGGNAFWIKEVEMVNAVDFLKSSYSLQGITPVSRF